MDLTLNNLKSTKFTKLSKSEILEIVLEVFNTVGYQFTDQHQLNLNFVSQEEMKVLNKTYRNQDKSTNCLLYTSPSPRDAS